VHFTVKILDPGRFAMGRTGRAPRRVAALFFVLFTLCGGGIASEAAAAADPFLVLGVAVDATAVDTNLARAKALTAGYREGLTQVFERLVLDEDLDRLPRLSDTQIAQMISGFEITNERVTSTRYRANLNVKFKPDSIRLELRNADLRFAETPGRPVVVLPILSVGLESRLWQAPNPWADAWTRAAVAAGLVPLILPMGDESDLRLAGVEQAVAGDAVALDRIAERYGARATLSVIAVPSKVVGSGMIRLDVTLLSREGSAQAGRLHLELPSGPEGWGTLFDQAVAAVTGRVNADWKQANVLEFDQKNTIDVGVTITGLADWLDIRGRLEALSIIRAVELRELSQSTALLRLSYLGAPEGMAFALRQAQLDLEETPEGWEVVRFAPAESASPP
jgi:hypothetical protein